MILARKVADGAMQEDGFVSEDKHWKYEGLQYILEERRFNPVHRRRYEVRHTLKCVFPQISRVLRKDEAPKQHPTFEQVNDLIMFAATSMFANMKSVRDQGRKGGNSNEKHLSSSETRHHRTYAKEAFSRMQDVLLGNFFVCADKPGDVLSLEKFRVSCGDMRHHKLGNAGAMLDLFVPVDRRESVAMRGSPFCPSDGQNETGCDQQRGAEFLIIDLPPIPTYVRISGSHENEPPMPGRKETANALLSHE